MGYKPSMFSKLKIHLYFPVFIFSSPTHTLPYTPPPNNTLSRLIQSLGSVSFQHTLYNLPLSFHLYRGINMFYLFAILTYTYTTNFYELQQNCLKLFYKLWKV